MIFELRGVQFENKGAELMLYAVVQQLQAWDQENIVAIRPKIGRYSQRAKAGLYQLLWSDKKFPVIGSSANLLMELIPQKTKSRLGLVTYPQVDVILDASGFNYSDQWGLEKTETMLELADRSKKSGKKVIFLPQAFGPFENPKIRAAFARLLSLSDLVFARDEISYQYLLEISTDTSNLSIAPDFTNMLKGVEPATLPADIQRRVCIIPNIRMLDKTSGEISRSYFHFLESSIKFSRERGLNPLLVVHETCDLELASALQEKVDASLEVIVKENPLVLKGLIGHAYAVIGSRFHGLINALSQGVPCVATGWSHKYRMLMNDYHCSDCLLDSLADTAELERKIDRITDPLQRETLVEAIQSACLEQKQLTQTMWEQVKKQIYPE